jgi:hypothetical protein
MSSRSEGIRTALVIGTLGLWACGRAAVPTAPALTDRLQSGPGAASTGAAVVTNTIIPVPPNTVINNPCTNEGVLVSGMIHLVTVTTVDAAGGTHTERHFNVQDVSGVGLRTGLNYRGIHTETHSSNSSNGGASEVTMVVDIKLISEGSASNLTIRDVLFHVTTNADGTVTASVDRITVADCQ